MNEEAGSVDEALLARFARARRLKFAAWLGAALMFGVVFGVDALIDAHGSVFLFVSWLAAALVFITTFLAVFQICPRCKKEWNRRGLARYRTPISRRCRNCDLPAPNAGPWQMGALLALLVPPVLAAVFMLGLHSC